MANDMFKDLKNNSPKSTDKSTNWSGPSVDSMTMRTKTAPTPKTLGGRTA